MPYTLNTTDADCYNGTTVLINKYGITDEDELNRRERFITSFRSAQLITAALKDGFSFDDYKHIHYELFSSCTNGQDA